jgi:ATP-dependent helicase HrpB
VAAAEELLARLGALDEHRRITPIGRRMLRLPAHPRQARIVVEAEDRGIAEVGCAIAALLGERDIWAASHRRNDARGEPRRSDLLVMLDALEEAELLGASPDRLRALGLDPGRVAAALRVQKQLMRLVDARKVAPQGAEAHEQAALLAILSGYPDRVGRLRRPDSKAGRAGREIVFATGGSAVLAESSAIGAEEYVVAVDAEERAEGSKSRAVVRTASAVEADWLLDLFTDRIRDTTDARWNGAQERIEVTRRLSYDGLVLEETRADGADPALVADALFEAASASGFRTFVHGEGFDRWLARVAFVQAHCPEAGLPEINEAAILATLRELCVGRRSFAELREANLFAHVTARLTVGQARQLEEWAPEAITLPGGRKLKLVYAADGTVSGASRLQDFFGMAEGPRIGRGRVPVVLHLCAPNQRPVQVTTDLSGFWERHYPAIARELRRRYPKHAWPDDPRKA